MKKIFTCVVVFLCLSATCIGTTIIPTKNYGELMKMSDLTIYAQCDTVYKREISPGISKSHFQFTVYEVLKGQIDSQTITILGYNTFYEDGLSLIVFGQPTYEIKKKYVINLKYKGDGAFQETMMGFGVLEEVMIDDSSYLFPLEEVGEYHMMQIPENFQKITGYKFSSFSNYVRRLKDQLELWDENAVTVNKEVIEKLSSLNRMAPDDCGYLADGNGRHFRWNVNAPIPVYEVEPIADRIQPATVITDAINAINSNYAITLNHSGTRLAGNCSNNSYRPHLTSQRGAHISIAYQEPCDDISTDLINCTGTLAIGGMASLGTHIYNGRTYNTIVDGFVITNDSSHCLSASNYTIMMTHEMTHTLGIGHTSGPNVNNMSPSCCIGITAKDIECLDYVYSRAVLPVDFVAFEVNKIDRAFHLKWIVENEEYTEYYLLEYSSDGHNFEVADTIYKNEELRGSYDSKFITFLDGDHFFRIKEVTYTNKIFYSPIRKVENSESSLQDLTITTSESSIFLTNLPLNQDIRYTIHSVGGLMVSQGHFYSGSSSFELPFQKWVAGVYYVNFMTGHEFMVKQLFVK